METQKDKQTRSVAERFFSEGRTPEDSELFFKTYSEKIKSFMREVKVPGYDFDDFFQEIALKLCCMKPERYREMGKIESWLYYLVKNFYVDRYKRSEELIFVDLMLIADIAQEERKDMEEAYRYVRQSLRLLTEVQNRSIQMYYFKGMKQKGICISEGISVCTLNKRLKLARNKMEQFLKEHGVSEMMEE